MDPKRSLSEISHLFLSEVRDRTSTNPRPARIPPKKHAHASIDMTPEEFAASLEADPADLRAESPAVAEGRQPRASVILSTHLADHHAQSVRQYARHLATQCGQIGLIEADSGDVGLMCFELNGEPAATSVAVDALDVRQLSETLAELSFDVDRWLISLPNPRTPEAREILRAAPHCVLLTTADNEGVVATYRALKGLAELGRPRLSLAVLDARDDAHADAVFRKLDAVSRQFLGCGLEAESPVRAVSNVTEHLLLNCRVTKKESGSAPQWQIINKFLSKAAAPEIQPSAKPPQPMIFKPTETEAVLTSVPAADAPRPVTAPRLAMSDESIPEIIDLPGDQTDRSILDAVVRQGGADGRWVQCPIHPPMCPEAILAVGRDHRLILLAIAGRGLNQLRFIGEALRWMAQNGELIRMALPQLAIDSTSTPSVRLLVDHGDLSADILQPMLETGTVTVQAYRKLKWGPKTGLLLEAA